MQPLTEMTRMRRARLVRGWPLVELARRSGVNATKLGQAERRARPADALTRAEQRVVAEAIGCDAHWLFDDEDAPVEVLR